MYGIMAKSFNNSIAARIQYIILLKNKINPSDVLTLTQVIWCKKERELLQLLKHSILLPDTCQPQILFHVLKAITFVGLALLTPWQGRWTHSPLMHTENQ